jgi:hypothetical protein
MARNTSGYPPEDPHREEHAMASLPKDWTQQWIHAKTQNTRFISRFGHTKKVSYSSLRSPQRTESFPTLVLHKPATKVKANSFLKSAQESGCYKLLGCPPPSRLLNNINSSRNYEGFMGETSCLAIHGAPASCRTLVHWCYQRRLPFRGARVARVRHPPLSPLLGGPPSLLIREPRFEPESDKRA